jgi:hypothetical protein
MTHAVTITMILSWVLPTMLTIGAGVIMYYGGYKDAEYIIHTSHSDFDRLQKV